MGERLYLSGRLKVPRNGSVGTVVSSAWGRARIAAALALTLASAAESQPAGIAATSRAAPNSATYDAVLEGMACKQQKSGRMDCEYRVGRSARFVVAGVGQKDVVVNFVQADSAGEYSVAIVPLHGCVVVKPTHSVDSPRGSQQYAADSVASFAYVSPQTGRVYHTWATCLNATRSEAQAEPKVEPKADAAKPPVTKVPLPDAKAPPPVKPPR